MISLTIKEEKWAILLEHNALSLFLSSTQNTSPAGPGTILYDTSNQSDYFPLVNFKYTIRRHFEGYVLEKRERNERKGVTLLLSTCKYDVNCGEIGASKMIMKTAGLTILLKRH